MPTITCNACNAAFEEEEEQRLHYRSEWHRYNLKRKVCPIFPRFLCVGAAGLGWMCLLGFLLRGRWTIA
jgi:hypothetical protein